MKTVWIVGSEAVFAEKEVADAYCTEFRPDESPVAVPLIEAVQPDLWPSPQK